MVKVNSEEELYKIIDDAHKQHLNNYVVRDAGRTQVPQKKFRLKQGR